MLSAFNARLKRYAPGLHGSLKQALARTKIPVPRLLLGRLVWTHSRFWNAGHNEPHVLRWIAESLRPGDVCFDVGAHHGWMSMVAARQVGDKGRVVAFEPAPALLEFLSYHKRVNRLSQMEIVAKAVSHSDGISTPFHLIGDGDSFMNSLTGLNTPENSLRGGSLIEIETVTLDTFSRVSGLVPNLIKIDTEGAELWVCEGAKQLLATHHPVLILATHPLWLPEGQRIEDLFEMLAHLGYRIVDSVVQEHDGADFGDYLLVAE